MAAKDPSDRRLSAQIASNARWARESNRTAATRPALEGMRRKFEQQVDPEGALDPVERAKRAESARKAHFQRLALKSAQARRAKKKGGGAAT